MAGSRYYAWVMPRWSPATSLAPAVRYITSAARNHDITPSYLRQHCYRYTLVDSFCGEHISEKSRDYVCNRCIVDDFSACKWLLPFAVDVLDNSKRCLHEGCAYRVGKKVRCCTVIDISKAIDNSPDVKYSFVNGPGLESWQHCG